MPASTDRISLRALRPESVRRRVAVLAGHVGLSVAATAVVACNALWGVDDLSFDGAGGAFSTTTSGGAGATTTTSPGGGGSGGGQAGGGGGGADGGTGGGCVLGAFQAPQNLGAINSADADRDPDPSADGLAMFFASNRAGGAGQTDIWLATRPATSSPFATPTNLTELNTVSYDHGPDISSDGLTIYFSSNRSGGAGDFDIWMAMRASVSQPFDAPSVVTELNTQDDEGDPSLTADGLLIAFSSTRAGAVGQRDLWLSSRASATAPFGVPTNLVELNSIVDDSDPALSADGLSIVFASDRSDSLGARDLYMATRPSRAAPFGPTSHLAHLSSTTGDVEPAFSADGRTLYFASDRPGVLGGRDLWNTTRSCE